MEFGSSHRLPNQKIIVESTNILVVIVAFTNYIIVVI